MRAILLCAGLALLGAQAAELPAQPRPAGPAGGRWRTLSRETRDAASMEAAVRRVLARGAAAAVSVAVLDGGEPVFAGTAGVADVARGTPAGDRTVFRAASLSKPVFAYLVLTLVGDGVIDLDKPIHEYLEKPLHDYAAYASFRDDPRYRQLTARLLLSHQGGLPNWRRVRPDGPIAFLADPGSGFAYSGEGYCLLQFVIETLTGRGLDALARERVFVPLGMTDSSFLWEDRFDGRFAVDLDSGLGTLIRGTRRRGNAAGSLITNASDYARFLAAVLAGRGLDTRARAAMLEPAVPITSRSLFGAPGTAPEMNRRHGMAWALGWGTFEGAHGKALFHVGREEGCENFALAYPGRGLGLVILSLTTSLNSFTRPLVEYGIGNDFSPLAWLEYEEAAPPARRWRLALAAVAVTCACVAVFAVWSWRRRAARRRH